MTESKHGLCVKYESDPKFTTHYIYEIKTLSFEQCEKLIKNIPLGDLILMSYETKCFGIKRDKKVISFELDTNKEVSDHELVSFAIEGWCETTRFYGRVVSQLPISLPGLKLIRAPIICG